MLGIRVLQLQFSRRRLTCSRSSASARDARGPIQLGMQRELRQHPDEAVGNRLAARIRRRPDNLDHRVNRHAVRRIHDEAATLVGITSHFRRRLSVSGFSDPMSCGSPSELLDLVSVCGLELMGDLKQIADNHLVVGLGAGVLLDRFRHSRRPGLDVFARLVAESAARASPIQSSTSVDDLLPAAVLAE